MLDRVPRRKSGRSVRVAPRVLAMLFLALALFGLGPSAPVFAGQTDDTSAGAESVAQVGVYITSLRDFDTAGDSFGEDYWVWSVHPPELDPLEDVEFVDAKQIESRLDKTSERGNVLWSRSKVRATVLHDWDLRNFPFDRQVLTMDLRIADEDVLAYSADTADSGYSEDIELEGWRIADFEIEERTVEYATTFGDPEASGESSQNHIFVTVEMERDSVTSFFKLAAGVYAAIGIALLSFLMAPDAPTVFSGRMAVLVGALFATVVNMQVSDSLLGRDEDLSLIDKIHIVAMIYIFAAALVAVISRKTYESRQKELARYRDRAWLYAFSLSFALINIALVAVAAIAG